MPTFENARCIVLDRIVPLGAERVTLLDAVGRVLTEDVTAPWSLPSCDNSAMDGYAVRAAGCATIPAVLRVTGFIPAGAEAGPPLEPGAAVKIMTGAPVPHGCDAVVPVEETEGAEGDQVTITSPVKAGQHIRFTGEDVRLGEVVIPAGIVVGPPEVSMLASIGRVLVPVHRKPRVAILSTGDELIEPGESPGPGQIINSNALSLAVAVRETGAEPVILGIARDNIHDHREKMLEGLRCDALITSAGVSAGDRDFVRDVLAELGVEQHFWKVDIKPGGPTAFGMKENKPVFSLPGNPVSTMVTFELFVRPALLKMMGHRRVLRPLVPGVLREEVKKKAGKLNLIRVRVEKTAEGLVASTAGDQHTGILTTMLRADALALLPKEAAAAPAGSRVELMILRNEALMEG